MRLILPLVLFVAAASAWSEPAATTSQPSPPATAAASSFPEQLSPRLDYPRWKPHAESAPFWIPYSAGLTDPLLSDESRAMFDKLFAADIAKARGVSPAEKVSIATTLERSVSDVGDVGLRLFVRAEAFRILAAANAPLPQRASWAGTIASYGYWPGRTDSTIAVRRLRAETLQALNKDAGLLVTPLLQEQTAAAYFRLAHVQLCAGLFKEAAQSVVNAKPFIQGRDKNLTAYLAAMTERVGRAMRANAEYTRAREVLVKNPADPVANAQIATLYLALFGDLETAYSFAAKSDRHDLLHLAELVKPGLANDLRRIDDLQVAVALLAVVEATKEPLDRFTMAEWALKQASRLRPVPYMSYSAEQRVTYNNAVEKLRRAVEARPAALPAFQDGLPADLKGLVKTVKP